MKKSLPACAAALALLALGAPAAQATATAIATLSGFSITLVDLDPDDGIAPSIVWAETDFRGSAIYARAFDAAGVSHFGEIVSPQPFAPGSLSYVTDAGQASASITGSLPEGGLAFAVRGISLGANADTNALAEAGRDTSGLRFQLSPHTRVEFTGSIDLFAQTTRGAGSVPAEFTAATAVVSVWISGSPMVSYGHSLTALCTRGNWPDPSACIGETLSESDIPLVLSLTNPSASSLPGGAYVSLRAFADSTLPVPEPSTYLLMLGGMAALRIRRRR